MLSLVQSSDETYVKNVHRWMLPFLDRYEKQSPGSAVKLMHEHLVHMAETDLTRCLKIFQNSRPEVQ